MLFCGRDSATQVADIATDAAAAMARASGFTLRTSMQCTPLHMHSRRDCTFGCAACTRLQRVGRVGGGAMHEQHITGTAEVRTIGRPMSCVPGYFEVINTIS